MPGAIRIFISSVQKELELERAAVAGLISTDPFLLQHCVPVLFEKEPPPARPAKQGYLSTLHSCALYVLIVANEYGQPDGEISATHHEYREAQKLKLPTVVFLKGAKDDARSKEVRALIEETKKDSYKYVRFHDREDLKPLMLEALRRALADEFAIKATAEEKREGDRQVDAASAFEGAIVLSAKESEFDADLIINFTKLLPGEIAGSNYSPWIALQTRGLAVRDPELGTYSPTAATFLLFGKSPVERFPQAELLVDAYEETKISGRPKGQETINAAIPHALDRVLKFIDAHTFHPRRVVGLNNLRLDEYPVEALREALVNAVAHRSYDDRSRKISVRIFSDRIEIASPGYPLQPLTLAKLRKGTYRPCSRNPLIAQTLATFGLMEQRGSGFARMQEALLNHGLDTHKLTEEDGYFVVTLPGPAGNYDRLKSPANAAGPVTPAVEARMNDRQKQIVAHVIATGSVTRGWCVRRFDIANDTAGRDLKGLTELGLLVAQGKGRAVRYTLKATDNRPAKT